MNIYLLKSIILLLFQSGIMFSLSFYIRVKLAVEPRDPVTHI